MTNVIIYNNSYNNYLKIEKQYRRNCCL